MRSNSWIHKKKAHPLPPLSERCLTFGTSTCSLSSNLTVSKIRSRLWWMIRTSITSRFSPVAWGWRRCASFTPSASYIPQQPPDTEIIPLSRTIGNDRVVDELIHRFTHTIAMDWMLPGIPPTGRRVEIPIVVVVQFLEGKIVSEHIYWDQASVLVQVGLIDPEEWPVSGAESARKVFDPASVPSNKLIERGPR